MSTYHVLLVGSKERISNDLPSILQRDSDQSVLAEAAATISDAVSRVARSRYDAVVCWAERNDELAGVIRIRKTRPDQPIMVITTQEDPHFRELAKIAGATRTVPAAPDSSRLSELIRLAVQSGELHGELMAKVRTSLTHAEDLRELVRQTRALTKRVRANYGKGQVGAFTPLLVEDDPDQAFLMVQAFKKADVHSPLPILRSGEEAIAYLSESPPFEHRTQAAPPPTVVLLGVELPGKSGLEVLEWIRQQRKFSRLPVVMLSCSPNPEYVNRAYQLGANSYLLKPTSFVSLVDMVSGLKQYWGSVNHTDYL